MLPEKKKNVPLDQCFQPLRDSNESGIASEWKNKQFYESPGEKKRRKKKESALEREKAKLRDHFSNRRGNNNGR